MKREQLDDQHTAAGVSAEQMWHLETLFKAIRRAASVDERQPGQKLDLHHIMGLAKLGEELAGGHANDYDVQREDLEREMDRLTEH